MQVKCSIVTGWSGLMSVHVPRDCDLSVLGAFVNTVRKCSLLKL